MGLPAGRGWRARRADALCSSAPTRSASSISGTSRYRARPFRGNLLSAAVSAIDLALWDIKGKALKLPVWELLGGRTRDRVRLHVLVGGGTPDEIVSSVNWAVEEGFTAVKFDPLVHGYEDLSMGQLVSSACSMAAAAREAGGDEIDLIFELHRKLDPAKAIVVCNALAQFHPLFIEDPIQIDSIETQAEICKRIDAPIATGERLSSIWEFSELLSRNVAILVRPDVGLAGGLSGCRKIAAIAEAHHCGVVPHNFLGPGLTAPTLHLCATIPNLVTMEYLPARRGQDLVLGCDLHDRWSATAASARYPDEPGPRRQPRRRLRRRRSGRACARSPTRGCSGQTARSQPPTETSALRPGPRRGWRQGRGSGRPVGVARAA